MTRFCAALLGFFILAYIIPLDYRPLMEPDETRYAEIPREMVDGGNWLELRLVGLSYYEKPPLGYWLGAASITALGQHPLAVRLPMALAAGATALTIFLLVRAQRGRTDLALGAAVIYLTFLEVYGLGTFANLDSIFTFFVTLSLALFFQAAANKAATTAERRRSLVWLILSGLACAGAFLTKGFTALVLPVLILAVWLPWQGLLRKHILACLVPVAAAALAVLPAALALHQANPDFWRYFFWVEHVQRFLEPSAGQHESPFWFFLPYILGGALPWIFCLPPALGPIWAKIKAGDSLTTFCLAWFALPFLFFSACGGKLPTYILPCFAPLAIMLAEGIIESSKNFSPYLKASAGFFLALALGAVVWLFFFAPPRLQIPLLADIRTWGLALALALTAAGLMAAAARFEKPATRLAGIFLTALATLPVFLTSFYSLPEALTARRAPSILLTEVVPLTPPEAVIFITDRKVIYAAAWHYRRNDLIFAFEMGELAYGLKRPEGEGRYIGEAAGLADQIRRELAAGRPAAVITAGGYEKGLAQALAEMEPDRLLKRGDFTWRLFSALRD